MITKNDAIGTKVDWEAVERATEVKRTYLVTDKDGHEYFKMYKPSEAKKIFAEKGLKGAVVGTLQRG